MFGYVRPSFPRLSEEDQRLFGAAYCGLCRTLGERYGAVSQFILNYDLTFLAILLAEPDQPEIRHGRCVPHPVRGRDYCVGNGALELAADCSVILSYWQLQDAVDDRTAVRGVPYRTAKAVLRRAYRKARTLRPAFDRSTQTLLGELRQLEKERCTSMDQAADLFARLLQGISAEIADPVKRRVMEQFFYHLGRWIYLVDAADDLEKDIKTGNYNPLICRFSLTTGKLEGEARKTLVTSLDQSIHLMAAAYELWDFGVWSSIIQSTVYEGLFCVGKAVLEGTFQTSGKGSVVAGRSKEQV